MHEIKHKIENTYKNIVSFIFKRTYVLTTPPSEIDLFDVSNYIAYEDFELGEEIRDYFNAYNNQLETFCKDAYNFIVCMAL